jgi:hypothetical protein
MRMDKLPRKKKDWYVNDMLNFEEKIFPVARMEEIILILAYACSKNIKVYQMDVKSTFLNGYLEEEVYIK